VLPFGINTTPADILSAPAAKEITRRLSDMRGFFHDVAAYEQQLAAHDALVYKVYEFEFEREGRGMGFACTVIAPGSVGREFHMTKGHFHATPGDEMYLGVGGHGRLLMFTKAGEQRVIEMYPGALAYIPMEWAHRSVNVGDTDFTFLSFWPSDTKLDYQTILEGGFPMLALKGAGGATGTPTSGLDLVANPTFGGRR
jgi:glucose-6-phosphate isomerase